MFILLKVDSVRHKTQVTAFPYPFRWQIVANLQRICIDRISAK